MLSFLKRGMIMKYCTNCGSPCEDGQKFCTNCGNEFSQNAEGQNSAPFGENCNACPPNQPPYEAPPYQGPNIPPYQTPYARSRNFGGFYGPGAPYYQNPFKGNATASLVLGILGILLSGGVGSGIVLSIIGLVLGSKAMKGYQKGEPGRGIAVAGFVCSIVGICLGAIVLMNLISTFFYELYYYR